MRQIGEITLESGKFESNAAAAPVTGPAAGLTPHGPVPSRVVRRTSLTGDRHDRRAPGDNGERRDLRYEEQDRPAGRHHGGQR